MTTDNLSKRKNEIEICYDLENSIEKKKKVIEAAIGNTSEKKENGVEEEIANSSLKRKKKVIIDTDIGIDDAQAITYLSAAEDLELVALTLVAGNASMGIITPNALRTLSYVDHEVPVYLSGSYNLSGRYIETDGYFGEKGFADIELPESKFVHKTEMTSAQALIHYARKYPGEISFLFVGPLTNLAVAFIMDNELPSLMGEIIIMGSDRSPETLNQSNKHAEFNALSDPVAYSIIGKCFKGVRKPIQILDWTTCRTHFFSFELIEKIHEFMNQNKNVIPHLELFTTLTDKRNSHLVKNFWESGFLTCDLWAAMSVNHPEIFCEKKRVRIKFVHIFGEKYGHTEYEDDENGFIELATKIDVDLASKILFDTFCRVRSC